MKKKDNEFILKIADFLGIFIASLFLAFTYIHLIKDNIFVSVVFYIFITYFILAGLFVNFKLKTYKKGTTKEIEDTINSIKHYTNFKLENVLYYCIISIALLLPFFFNTYDILFSIIIIINFSYQTILQIQILKEQKKS
jgi:hypothetical protein